MGGYFLTLLLLGCTAGLIYIFIIFVQQYIFVSTFIRTANAACILDVHDLQQKTVTLVGAASGPKNAVPAVNLRSAASSERHFEGVLEDLRFFHTFCWVTGDYYF